MALFLPQLCHTCSCFIVIITWPPIQLLYCIKSILWVLRKKDLFSMNEMDLKFSKIVIFSNQYRVFRNPKMLLDGLDVCLPLK